MAYPIFGKIETSNSSKPPVLPCDVMLRSFSKNPIEKLPSTFQAPFFYGQLIGFSVLRVTNSYKQ
ncbi:MAG: hypothetical protein ACJAWH_000733 [Maribacter sp.]|jgi:hypothetical protein